MSKTYLWRFEHPAERAVATICDDVGEAEEAIKEHLAQAGIPWDEAKHGEICDHIEQKKILRPNERWVWEV